MMNKKYWNFNELNKFSFVKYFFYMILLMSTLITINSLSWFNMWMGMEINLMSFIPIMIMNNNNNKISNSMMTYFIIQASASSVLLMMIILMKIQFNLNKINLFFFFIQMSLLMKLGATPFHWWTPKIFNNLNWLNCFIFLTWQKIAPLFMLINMNNNLLIYLSSLMSTFMGALLGMNQSSLKMILIYSSINHTGWMLMNLITSVNLLFIYFIIYSIMNLLICMILNNYKMNYLNQLFKNFNQNMNIKIFLLSIFFSLAGLPPFLGFLPKLISLMIMIKNNFIIESIMFIIMATMTLSFYMNPLLSIMTLIKFNNKFNNNNFKINKMIFLTITINLILMFIIFKINLINLL